MTTLTGRKPRNTYKDLLQVSNSNAGIDATLRAVEDGEGTESALKVSTTAVELSGVSVSDGRIELTRTSGDPYVLFDINGTDKFVVGVDDSDGDVLVGSLGGTPGTSNFLRVSAAGEITMPLQPAFLAIQGSGQTNVATGATLQYSTEVYDQNADYNAATYTFTVPVTGRYLLCATARLDSVDADYTQVTLAIVTSNRSYFTYFNPSGVAGADFSNLGMSISHVCDMDAADTAHVEVAFLGGVAQMDIGSSAGNFSGVLVA